MIARRLQYELVARAVAPTLAAVERLSALRKRGRRRDPGNFGPPLASSRKLKELLTTHYLVGRYADGAVPVAWATSGFPVEVLRPFGYHVVYPENHAALCGARKLVPDLSDVAEQQGYSRDLCGYARSDLGSALSGSTPVGRLPRPDLLACCTNICQTVLGWYRSLAAHFGVPLVLVDTPFVYGEATAHQLAYVEEQLHDAADIAARVARQPLDLERFVRLLHMSRDGSRLWRACLATGMSRPAPWTAFDAFVHMAPIVALRGTEACNDYYRGLLAELEDRVARGVGGIREEKHRLLWDNLPIWHALGALSKSFAAASASFVCATYTSAWAEPSDMFDNDEPFRALARAYSHVLLNRDLPNRRELIARLAREFSVAGVVLHSDRSCKPYSIGQIDLKRRLSDELGIPVLLLEACHADPRTYAEEQLALRIQAFLEGLS